VTRRDSAGWFVRFTLADSKISPPAGQPCVAPVCRRAAFCSARSEQRERIANLDEEGKCRVAADGAGVGAVRVAFGLVRTSLFVFMTKLRLTQPMGEAVAVDRYAESVG
jgi:hypothetical protein